MSETLRQCFELRKAGYVPYRKMNTGRGIVELISYPFPEDGGIFIMARREIGEPISIARFELAPKGLFQ